jgi:N-acetylmuramoyl-L-alanine amidase
LKVGIDAGHGGDDPGAISRIRPELKDQLYTEEADVALEIAKRVQGILLACDHEAVMTRTNDVSVPLRERTNILNAAKCDIAVSIHLNSTTNPMANYIATFIQATGGQAQKIANYIQPKITAASGWANGGVRAQNLHMTRETNMPAVLVELGFISNPDEERQLNDSAFKGKLAVAIADGILQYAGDTWTSQQRLLGYAADPVGGNKEIDRCSEVYTRKKVAGDLAGANAAHLWTNRVRQAMGLPTT